MAVRSRYPDPIEFKSAVTGHRQDILDAAVRHDVVVSEAGVFAAVNAAVDAGAIDRVDVTLPDSGRTIQVVGEAAFLADLDRFFATSPELPPGARVVPPSSGRPKWTWRPAIRWIIERTTSAPETVCRYTWAGPLRAIQHKPEIIGLLELLRARKPRSILEIGTLNGATTYLLSRFTAPNGTVVTCDVHTKPTTVYLQGGARRGRTIETLEADSHDEGTRRRLHERFPDGVDVLFIDGDHRYEGVRQDLLGYADLLRPGGLLVLHDIVEDYRTRYGIRTNSFVGGVPRLWGELRASLPDGFVAREFIQDEHQDGLGIGVVECPDVASPGRTLLAAFQR